MFIYHYHKVVNSEIEIRVQYNYCPKDYAFGMGHRYGTLQNHTTNKYSNEWVAHYHCETNTKGKHVSSISSLNMMILCKEEN